MCPPQKKTAHAPPLFQYSGAGAGPTDENTDLCRAQKQYPPTVPIQGRVTSNARHTKLAPCHIAGCCHLENWMASSRLYTKSFMAIAATVSRNVATITKHRHIVTSVIKRQPEITPWKHCRRRLPLENIPWGNPPVGRLGSGIRTPPRGSDRFRSTGYVNLYFTISMVVTIIKKT